MLAFTRTQSDMASSAASRAERHHSICLPSGGGSRTGQKNRVPCRLTAVYNVLVTNSPASSGTSPAVTMLGAYDIYKAESTISDPEWPEEGFWDLIRLAFRDHLITTIDHPIIKRLRGLA